MRILFILILIINISVNNSYAIEQFDLDKELSSITDMPLVIKKPPLIKGNSIFHWHKKFALKDNDIKDLLDCKIKGIFLLAGEFYLTKTNSLIFIPTDITPTQLRKLQQMQIHLVFIFSRRFTRYFLDFHKPISSAVVDRLDKFLKYFEGVNIAGIQLDMEGLKLDLLKYKFLVDSVYKKFKEKYLISVTTMPYWIKNQYFKNLISNVDFHVPMLYNFGWGITYGDNIEVTDCYWIYGRVKDFDKLGIPFYASVPSYSYCLVFGPNKVKIPGWHRFRLDTLTEHPFIKILSSRMNRVDVLLDEFPITEMPTSMPYQLNIIEAHKKYNGDNIYEFEVLKDIKLGKKKFKKGSKIVINRIYPIGLKKYLRNAEAYKGINFKGSVIFRWGEQKDRLTLNALQLKSVFKKGYTTVIPDLQHTVKEIKDDEGNIKKYLIKFSLKNTGNSGSFVGENANGLIIKLTNAKIISFYKGNFDSSNTYLKYFSDFIPVKKEMANYIVLKEKYLHQKELCKTGSLFIKRDKGPLKVEVLAWTKLPDKPWWYSKEKKILPKLKTVPFLQGSNKQIISIKDLLKLKFKKIL